jgi:hypothetical protein
MKLLDGERLSEGPFIVKLTMEEMGLIAWSLMYTANGRELGNNTQAREDSRQLSYQFADVVGIH